MTTTTSHDSCLHWKVGSDDHWPDLPVQNPLLSTLIPRPLAWLCIDDTSVCILDGFTAACYTPPTILCAANALPESVVQKLRSHPVCTLSVVTTRDPMESIQMALTAQHQKLTQLYSLEQIGLSTIKVNAEYPVVIQSSPLHLLCHVEQFVPVDEPAEDEFLLITVETFHIAGEVLSHASQEMKQRPGVVAKIDAQLIDAMVHLAEGRVVPLRRLRSMPRPVKQESGTWISPPFVDVLPPMKGTFPDATWSYREHGGTSPLGYNATTALLMPRPIGWISTYKKDTKQPHLAPYSFFTDVSRGPIPYVAFSAYCGRSKKDAHRNAEETGFFVCNMPTEELAIAMNLSAAELSRDESEFELAHLVADSATWVDAPIVPQAPIRYECQYVKTVVEHSFAIVIGRVIGISINRSVIAGGSVNISLIRPLTRLGYMDEYGCLS